MTVRTKQSRRSKIALSSAALAAIGLPAIKAAAQYQTVFTQWNFDAIGTVSPDNGPAPTTALNGTATTTALGMTNNYQLSDGSTFSVNDDDVTGSNPMDPNQTEGPGNTYAWRVRGNGSGGGNGWSNSAPEYTQGAEFDTTTVGLSGIIFSCDMFCTNQGIHTMQEQYTTDGTDWINFGSVIATVPNGYLYDLKMNFSGTAYVAVNNDASFGVRLVACYDTIDPSSPAYNSTSVYSAGANGSSVYNNSSGNWRFANVTFSYNSMASAGNENSYPVMTWDPPGTTWNGTNTNWLNTNSVNDQFGGTSTIAAFTDSVLPSSTSSATVSVTGTGVATAGVMVSNTNGTYTFSGGPISGGAFTKTGGGNVVLSQGTNANTFNGLAIDGGTLHTANDAYLGAATSTITLNGGTLVADAALNIAHNILVGTNGGDISSNFSVTSSGSFNIQGAFAKLGSGNINFTTAVSASPGSTFSVLGGNVTFSGTSARSIVSTPASGTTFAGNIIINNSKGFTVTGGNVAGPGQIEINNNNSEFTGDSITGTTYTTINMPIVIQGGTSTTWTEAIGASGVGDIMVLEPTAVISGTSNVIFAGGNSGGKATLIIDSQNTYNGNTIINNDSAGLTQLGVNNPFPLATNLSFGDGTNTSSIGAIDMNGYNMQLGSLATNLPNGSNRIAQFANGITNSSANLSTIMISGTASTVFNAVIGTPTGVILANAGNNIALTLAASNTGTLELEELNTYAGTTTINGGTLQFDAAMDTIGYYTLSSMPVGNNIVNNALLVINSPDTVAGNISGSGTTTVNGTSLSYIGTLLTPNVTATAMVQGALINNGYTTINVSGNIGSVSGAGVLSIGTGGGTASVSVGSFNQSSVVINDQAKLALIIAVPQVTNTAGTLTINGAGQLDLANHSLITGTDPGTIRQYLINGYNGGAWNGTGGISSVNANASYNIPASNGGHFTALGYTSGTSSVGAALGLATNQTLVKYTIYGDANLDGTVDINDLNIVLSNFLSGNPGTWDTGDFYYAGQTDISDLDAVLSNYFDNASPTVRAARTANSLAKASASTAHTLTGTVSPADTVSPLPASGVLELVVNVTSGDVELEGNNADIASLQITSASSGIITANWTDLHANGYTNWSDTAKKKTGIGEYDNQFTASGDYAVLGVVDYGDIYNTSVNAEDYVFKYGSVESNDTTVDTDTGLVLYVGVPEPTTLSLMGLAAAGLMGRRRRRLR